MIVETSLGQTFMHLHLDDNDFSRMPEGLRLQLLDWFFKNQKTNNLPSEQVAVRQQPEAKAPPTQLILNLESRTPEDKTDNSHVKLSWLFDAGITNKGMPVRVRLIRKLQKKLGREYINGLEISAKGTIVYDGQEFDKPSPLAAKINGGAANGWEYIEVKKNDQWVCLEELRNIWRKTND